MNYNFTGAVTQRRINLGSAHEVSSAELAQQAREERALRLEIRQRHAAATAIQSAARGRKSSQLARQSLQQRLEGVESEDFLKITMIVSLATRRHAIFKRLSKAGSKARLSPPEQRALTEDDVLLKEWATRAVQGSAPNVLSLMKGPSAALYLASLSSVLHTILNHFIYQGAVAQAGYQVLIDVVALLISHKGPASKMKAPRQGSSQPQSMASSWCVWLGENDLYRSLRAHLMSIVSGDRAYHYELRD